jgi:hypothetical protein
MRTTLKNKPSLKSLTLKSEGSPWIDRDRGWQLKKYLLWSFFQLNVKDSKQQVEKEREFAYYAAEG